MITLFHLITEFFKIGLFSIGGGYATIPFLYQISHQYGWYSIKQLSDMIAISMITPGPVGVNMATFAGFQTFGIIGGIIATISMAIPTLIFVILISKILKKYNENFWIKAILYTLKPTGCGLLLAVGTKMFFNNVTTKPAIYLFIFLFLISFKFKKNPLYYFLFSAIIGIILQLCGIKFI